MARLAVPPCSGLGLMEVRDRRWGRDRAKYWPPAPETTDPDELFKLDCRLDGLNSLLFRKDFRLKSFNMVNHDRVLKRCYYTLANNNNTIIIVESFFPFVK